MSTTRWRSLRPAGSPEAPLSARSCLRLPPASASLGQSVHRAALAGHPGLVFDIGAAAWPMRWSRRCAVRPPRTPTSAWPPPRAAPPPRPRSGSSSSPRRSLRHQGQQSALPPA
eukprot:scaffold54714_cov59-Phaeocystis_antarctica.AAC.3